MKGSHPFVLRQNSDTARQPGGRHPTRRVGETEGEREGAKERGHVVSSRSEIILREYLAGTFARMYRIKRGVLRRHDFSESTAFRS
jgi:hypothetical protein